MSNGQYEQGRPPSEYEITPDSNKKTILGHEGDAKGLHRIDTKIEKMMHERAALFEEELLNGFHAVNRYPKSVTFFGSARLTENDPNYKKAREIAGLICKEGYTVITGGGAGIMEAGNRGTKETCGYGVGFNIELPDEQIINPYVTHGVNFSFFSARKTALFFSAETYLFFPGGFGTMDEFFQLVTLIQTHKAPRTPVILVGSSYWNRVDEFIQATLLDRFKTIDPDDLDIYTILDDSEKIMEIIRNAPLRKDYDA
jgi:hypothetical protein